MKPTLCIVILLVLAVSTSFPITLTTSRLSSWACLHQDFSHTPKALPHLQKLCPHLQMLCFSIFFCKLYHHGNPPPPGSFSSSWALCHLFPPSTYFRWHGLLRLLTSGLCPPPPPRLPPFLAFKIHGFALA